MKAFQIQDQLRKRNAMVEAIKWYAVALIQIRVLERIAIESPYTRT